MNASLVHAFVRTTAAGVFCFFFLSYAYINVSIYIVCRWFFIRFFFFREEAPTNRGAFSFSRIRETNESKFSAVLLIKKSTRIAYREKRIETVYKFAVKKCAYPLREIRLGLEEIVVRNFLGSEDRIDFFVSYQYFGL